MATSSKTYAPGSCKRANTDFFCVRIGIPVEKFKAFLEQHKNAKGYVNLNLAEKRETDQFGNTHTMTLDTWEPKANPEAAREGFKAAKKAAQPEQESGDTVPF